jgi:hypothetical protein
MVNTVKLATYGIQDTSIHKKQDKDKQTGNIGYTRHLHTQDKDKQKKNKKQSTIWVRYHNAQTNTASVNKT